jgi:prepilin-type processing-associated H-X9-DG protein
MNQAVGTICNAFRGGSHSGAPNIPTVGPWLTGNHNRGSYSIWNTYGKGTSIGAPGPAMIWVYIDESTVGLNDGGFAVSCGQQKWVDFPGFYHNNACGFAFLDGHSEIHKWRDQRTFIKPGQSQVAANGSVDWAWIAQRTSARRN